MMFTRIIHTQAQAQAEREWLRAVQKADDARRKERMQNDSEYREQLLQRRKTKWEQKRKALEEDLLHADARKDADKMIKVRRIAKETQKTLNVQKREKMIEKVCQRYNSYNFSNFNTL